MKNKGNKIAEKEFWNDIIDDCKNLALLVFTVIVFGSLIKYLFSQTYIDISLILLAVINIMGMQLICVRMENKK